MAGASPRSEFEEKFAGDCKDVFRELAASALADGADAIEQAHDYAERGKPEFVLAYLLVAELADGEKREVYARAFERRAVLTEERAREFDRTFHRSFAMLFTEAGKDRAAAQRIRGGRLPRSGVSRQLPMR